tara:strand:- start:243 stop:473 length:231 start_codon:yes stop_codon:yes gene_type:complete
MTTLKEKRKTEWLVIVKEFVRTSEYHKLYLSKEQYEELTETHNFLGYLDDDSLISTEHFCDEAYEIVLKEKLNKGE